MNSSKMIHSLLVPPPKPERILYRLPFLVNMVFIGYLNYWRFKAGLLDWPAEDAAGLMGFAAFIGFFSWCIAGFLVLLTFRKKRDIPGLIYLLTVMILTIYLNILELAVTGLIPSS